MRRPAASDPRAGIASEASSAAASLPLQTLARSTVSGQRRTPSPASPANSGRPSQKTPSPPPPVPPPLPPHTPPPTTRPRSPPPAAALALLSPPPPPVDASSSHIKARLAAASSSSSLASSSAVAASAFAAAALPCSPPLPPPSSASRHVRDASPADEPIAQPASPCAAHDNMPSSRKTPALLAAHASGSNSPSYGALANTPALHVSQTDSDSEPDDGGAHRLGYVHDSVRSRRSMSSRRSGLSRVSSRRSDDFDGAALLSGLEGRFGLAEAPLLGEILDHEAADSDDYDDDDTQHGLLSGGDDDDDDDDSSHTGSDFLDDSPHEAVRASVPPTDNPTLSINTPRMWCLSVIFSILGSSTNLFFSLRYPSVAITPVIALLLVHPLGHLWDMLLKRPYDPDEEFVDGCRVPSTPSAVRRARDEGPSRARKPNSWRLWLAQGRWNEKEHTCVYVSSNVAFGFAFATDVIVEQTRFYKQEAPVVYQLLLTISTQILGYGFAGMARRFLVRPSGMIWPGTLMSAAMFSTLHKQDNKPANGWTISRWNFFYIVWTVSFAFYFLPGLLFPALSYFNVITWFAPRNVVVANLFGVASGLGLFPLTFDWAQVTYVGSPLLVPWWAAVNVIGGLVVVMWIIAPILYYSNVLYSSYMPILSPGVFDNTGHIYNVTKILTPDFLFDRDAYAGYSRVFLPITYVLSYGVQFAGLAALLTHTLCWHGHDIWRTLRRSLREARRPGGGGGGSKTVYHQQPAANGSRAARSASSLGSEDHTWMSGSTSNVDGLLTREDIHCRLMNRYKDAPLSWYLLTFASMAAIGMFVVEYYPVHLPWYGLLLALGLGAIFFIPNGIIMAITNQHSSIYLICQLICGVVFPGRPIANMVFVTYGYISSAQGIKFAADLKLGHYMKIPPRVLFVVQVVATLVSSVTQIGVLNWMFANVDGVCTPEAVSGFTCPIARVHFNGSILWGVVGPGEFFGPAAIYRALVWCFPLGALLPVPLWLYARRRRASLLRKVNLPVILGAMSWIPPATGLNFSVWALVCYLFNSLIKRRAHAWWGKYTMTLSAALDSGLAFGIVVVFFGFVYPDWMAGFRWWGTEVHKQGCDWQACPYRSVPAGETFGPREW